MILWCKPLTPFKNRISFSPPVFNLQFFWYYAILKLCNKKVGGYMGIGISPTWTFKEVVKNIKTIKLRYEEVLLSFSVYELRNEIEFRREARNSVYALNMQEWKKDRIWDYINGFQEYGVLEQICKREQKNGNKR